ncbi:MAG: amylo-alpha-1,6-glucosidase, partial [Chloroflexota bacterium]
QIIPLLAHRDFHAHQQGSDGWWFEMIEEEGGWRVDAFPGAQPYWIASSHPAGLEPGACWYWSFLHREERDRGLDFTEDLYRPGTLSVALLPDQPVLFRASAEVSPAPFEEALARAERYAGRVSPGLRFRAVEASGATDGKAAPPAAGAAAFFSLAALKPLRGQDKGGSGPAPEASLRFAADQFLVRGGTRDGGAGRSTVIAGYHWFGDWGRDTMIALPGLAIATGRLELAAEVLRTFAGQVDQGMLPNNFGEQGGREYNTVDATLWFFQALDRYLRASSDNALLKELYTVLESIVDWHLKGTRYHIEVDPADGLLYAGEEGVQLTWMDARVDGWVVTPRIGKPVEVNALWFNALCLMSAWARELSRNGGEYERLASLSGKSFRTRYWNASGGCLFDVLDGPEGNDASLRPNQVFAVALPFAALFGDRAKAVVDVVAARLLTPYGLRTLSPDDPRYIGRYEGDRRRRDAAYHQGTVWPWLIGPFVDAHLRVYRDKASAARLLHPLLAHMAQSAGVGTISEIFDGDEPHQPRGCIAQAWSVAEALRCWTMLNPAPGGTDANHR